MNIPLSNLSSSQRETLEKYLPLLFVLVIAWFVARGAKEIFWTAFGLFWAFHWSGGSHWFLR